MLYFHWLIKTTALWGNKMIIYRLKELAAAKNWTKSKLHYASGISYPTISRIWDADEGKNPIKQIDMDVLDSLCVALACEPGDLIKRVQP